MIKEELKIISATAIAAINADITGTAPDQKRASACGGSLSSYFYYETKEEMIASIVLAIIKGHYFVDGNKRTSLAVFDALCELNGMSNAISSSSEIISAFTRLAAGKSTVHDAAKLLFKL